MENDVLKTEKVQGLKALNQLVQLQKSFLFVYLFFGLFFTLKLH